MVQITILSVHAQKEGIEQKSLFSSNDRILSVMIVYQLLIQVIGRYWNGT